jgi:hypothetical protein
VRPTSYRLYSALLVLLALSLTVSATATGTSAQPRPLTTSTSPVTCTPWLFDGCCPKGEEHQKRTCTDGTVSFTETQCIVVPECV